MLVSAFGITVVAVVASARGRIEGAVELLLYGFSAVGLVGCWKLAMPDPVRAKQRPFFNIEDMTRTLAAAAFFPLTWVSTLSYSSIVGIPGILFPLFVLVGPVSVLLLFILLRRLALRIPNGSLARQTRMVMWGLVISLAAIVVYVSKSVAPMVAMAFYGVPWIRWIVTASCLAFPVFGIWWIVLLFRYRSAFRQAARIASGTSPAAAPPDTIERPNQNGRP